MTQIIPLQKAFDYDGHQVRTVVLDGEPYFVAKDVCEFFGDTNYRRSVARLDDDEKGVSPLHTPGGVQEMAVVSEAGLYTLLWNMQPQQRLGMDPQQYQKRVDDLKSFKRWITHEVIPSIRQTGSYDITQRRLPRNYVEALEDLLNTERERVALAEQVALQAPKVEMYETLLGAKNAQTMGEVAKCFGWGRNKLFARLRDKKVLMRNNLPYQQYLDSDYFEVREVTTSRGDCRINVTQTLVTAKGLDFLGRLLGRAS